MEVVRSNVNLLEPVRDTVLTLGTFDGVHLAHRRLLDRVCRIAAERDLLSTLVTFSPHPRLVLQDPPPRIDVLSDMEEKLELLRRTPLQRVVIVNFTPELALMPAEAFIREILAARVGFRCMVIGHNHAFGHRRSGNARTLSGLARQLDFQLEVLDPVLVEGDAVSSTRIRKALAAGNLEGAQRMLDRPYSFTGQVVKGRSRGHEIGYPTANLQLRTPEKLLPPSGVYAVRVQCPEGHREGMMNLGARPTFDEQGIVPEVHLFDFDETIYGVELKVEILCFVRDTIKFESSGQLARQLEKDRKRIQGWLRREVQRPG